MRATAFIDSMTLQAPVPTESIEMPTRPTRRAWSSKVASVTSTADSPPPCHSGAMRWLTLASWQG